MNKILLFVMASFLTAGCTKVSDYVQTVIPALRQPEPEIVQKAAPNLCPADKPNAQVIEGECDGDWTVSYDSASKIYTCSFKHKTTVTCPAGSISIGQPSGCGSQVDQRIKSNYSASKCESEFKNDVIVAYRLVCCT